MSADCPFCGIVGAAPSAHEIWRSSEVVAFLDTRPIRPGHLQIVPVAHHDTFDTLPVRLSHAIMDAAQWLARLQKRVLAVERVAFLYTGGDIAHVHAHLVPMHEKTDITSRRYIAEHDLTFRDMPKEDAATLAALAQRLREGA